MSIKSIAGADPVIQQGEYDAFRYEVMSPTSTTSTLKIYIPEGQSVKAIPGCMFATSANIEIKGKLKKTFKAMLGPDDASYQMLTAKEGEGWVLLAPGFYGSITPVPITNEEICVGDDALLCSIGDIETTSKSQEMKKAMFSGSGLFVKKAKGTGVMFVCAVGSMMTFELAAEETVVVDNGHLVTWPAGITYDIKKASKSWFSSGISGEGVVARITGPGVINVQTRNPEEMAEWIYSTKMPPTTSG